MHMLGVISNSDTWWGVEGKEGLSTSYPASVPPPQLAFIRLASFAPGRHNRGPWCCFLPPSCTTSHLRLATPQLDGDLLEHRLDVRLPQPVLGLREGRWQLSSTGLSGFGLCVVDVEVGGVIVGIDWSTIWGPGEGSLRSGL